MEKTKKIRAYSEINYILSIIILAFAVCMTKAADFGMSMIVAPAFIISEKFSFISFGVGEYIIQGILFVIFCILLKKVKWVYFVAFGTSVIYGFVLDLVGRIPLFNPDVIAPASLPIWVRIILFVGGAVLTTFSVALSFHTYILPQLVDFFVHGVTGHFGIKLNKFKTFFDLSYLALALILTFVFFGELRGIGLGTLILALTGGTMIGFFDKLIKKCTDEKPIFPKVAKVFKTE